MILRATVLFAFLVHGAVAAASAAAQVEGSEPARAPSAGGPASAPEEPQAAERRLRAALRLNPEEASFHARLGEVLREQGRLFEAVESHRTAVRLAPASARHRAELAAALLEAKRWDSAALEFRQAIRLDSTRAEYHAGLGEALRQQQLLLPAADAFRQAARMEPDNPEFSRLLREVEESNGRAGPNSDPSRLMGLLSLAIRGAMAAVLILAGIGLLLPVAGGAYLLLVVAPLSLRRRQQR